MPNWCMNRIEISCDDPEKIEVLVKRLMDLEEDAFGEVSGFLTALDPDWDQREAAGATFEISEGVISADFETAWSPPTDLYDFLDEAGYTVWATYFEPGMQIAGIYSDGFDEHVEYSDVDDDFWESELGKELDDIWGIKDDVVDDWPEDDD